MVHAIAANFYVQYLAARIPDERLARRARAVLWAAGIALGVAAIGVVTFFLPFAIGVTACGFVITLLVVVILYIAMIDRLKSSMVAILVAR